MPTEKQLKLLEILRLLLPYARNIETQPKLYRFFKIDLYPELELIHKIPALLDNESFTESDTHWINTQARNYIKSPNAVEYQPQKEVIRLIKNFIDIVPDNLKIRLI